MGHVTPYSLLPRALHAAAATAAAATAAAPAAAAAAAGWFRCFASITASEARQGNWLVVDGGLPLPNGLQHQCRTEACGPLRWGAPTEAFGGPLAKPCCICRQPQQQLVGCVPGPAWHAGIEPEKHVLQVMYVDQDGGVVVMADSDFDEVRVPLRLFGGPAVAEHLTQARSEQAEPRGLESLQPNMISWCLGSSPLRRLPSSARAPNRSSSNSSCSNSSCSNRRCSGSTMKRLEQANQEQQQEQQQQERPQQQLGLLCCRAAHG
ncbi:hypothetical protein ACSSS7_006067 [Eimeria intestinalis]